MSAGTLSLTNNNAIVNGTGTAFTTELAAGDFIVVIVGGVPYTLPIKSVDSATTLTLVSNYTGPTQSGAAWSAVPRVALNMVTAALVAQSAEALRGLNYDKQNWQQFFTADGDVTITLPDTSNSTGPSAKKLINEMSGKADKSSLGSAASKNTGTSSSDVMQPGMFGIGRPDGAVVFNVNSIDEILSGMNGYGLTVLRNNAQIPEPWYLHNYSPALFMRSADTYTLWCAPFENTGAIRVFGGAAGRGWLTGRRIWDDVTTTVDGNGFIKRASPIVKIFSDGTFETNDESAGAAVERVKTGVYKISGVLGLNADAAWGGTDGGFEIPLDRNKQPRIWLDYKVLSDGSVQVKTFHRVHASSPAFAQNRIGTYDASGAFTETVVNGEAVDIPADSFVSVRVEMPTAEPALDLNVN